MPTEWTHKATDRADGGESEVWAAFRCTTCGSIVTARCRRVPVDNVTRLVIDKIYPDPKIADADLPPMARKFLQQAYETLHAPDAAAVMAGSAVDAMLKKLGYTEGSVYARIEKSVADNVLTEGMGKWAHEVRLGANRPRHADEKNPHVSAQEAKQSVEFAEALGQFLFVLAARIDRGVKEATDASASGP